ncbi:uncharacterized protein LOC127836812 [Dreissena polymorpha]|uniref:uncharacterized protein LOC127836812 n=1 Tax=Dreissena polymorpha TaxID=45954 RepID=UPI0022650439|nr:uncharacterized protein LOC127836812 [Dreissena polymorpha]
MFGILAATNLKVNIWIIILFVFPLLSLFFAVRGYKTLQKAIDSNELEWSARFQVEPRAHQVPGNRTRILENYLSILQRGDHVAWRRLYYIWHHAIVEEVYVNENKGLVIQWHIGTSMENKTEILKENVTLVGRDPFYRINYSHNDSLSVNVTMQRANSLIGLKNYSLIYNNCESFASFCKTGHSESLQVRWLWEKREEIKLLTYGRMTMNIVTLLIKSVPHFIYFKVSTHEMTNQWIYASSLHGSIFVIVFECLFMLIDLNEIIHFNISNKLTHSPFLYSVIGRCTETLVMVMLNMFSGFMVKTVYETLIVFCSALEPYNAALFMMAVEYFTTSVYWTYVVALGGRVFGTFWSYIFETALLI